MSRIYPSARDWRQQTNGIGVRVIEYRLEGVPEAEPSYRLVTTMLDHQAAPAAELAALDHERGAIETALDELKTHRRGAQVVLRSQTAELVKQEFDGFLLAHCAVRGLMHEAALTADEAPARLASRQAVRVLRRQLLTYGAIPPRQQTSFHQAVLDELRPERVVSSRQRWNPRGIKRKMSNYRLRAGKGKNSPGTHPGLHSDT